MGLGPRTAELIDRARASDDAAWGEIYMEFSPPLHAYLRSRAPQLADDVLGETFFQAVRDIGHFEGSEPELRAWLFTIARHRLIDEMRLKGRRPETPTAPEDLAPSASMGDAEEEALLRLSVDEALGRIRELSEDQQDVLVLRLVGDLSIDQVAQVVEKTPGAVKQLQRRALAALQRNLSAQAVTQTGAGALLGER